MKTLFIGGPAAGRLIEVNDRVLEVMIPSCRPAGYYSLQDAAKEVDGSFSYRTYFRRSMTDNTGKEHFIFADPDCDPMLELMSFYAENKK